MKKMKYYYVVYAFQNGHGCFVYCTRDEFNILSAMKAVTKHEPNKQLIITNWKEISETVYKDDRVLY